jgi:hypothetical protein
MSRLRSEASLFDPVNHLLSWFGHHYLLALFEYFAST